MPRAVQDSAELRRVLAIPRRQAAAVVDGVDLVDALTAALGRDDRCPGAKLPAARNSLCSVCGAPVRLRPLQAIALHDIAVHGGAFLALGVGEGKTLITLLAPYVLGAQIPLLLLPANLIKKTERDIELLSRHWLIPTNIFISSYELLGRVQAADTLAIRKPDLIIGDEAHKLKNLKAAVTRRLARHVSKHPDTPFVLGSGSFMRKSMRELAHLLLWTLKDNAPVPFDFAELDDWATALDEVQPTGPYPEDFGGVEPGALLQFCNEADRVEADGDDVRAARLGFRRRLIETPGVVASSSADERVAASLHIRAITYKMKPETCVAFTTLRKEWKAPADEYPLTSGAEVWAHARALAAGLTYVWEPRPPEWWLEPRKAWGQFVRGVLSHSHTLDSELHVAQAVQAGRLDDRGRLDAWLAVKDQFTPNPVPVWHDDSTLHVVSKWAEQPGIVWTTHAFFAQRLATLTGLEYYGAEGLDASGQFIDDASNERAIIASAKANREGRNLQVKWSRNLIVCPEEGPDWWQQLLGRTHRKGQQADEVTVDVLLGCLEHQRAWLRAVAGAKAVRDTTGADNRLLIADVEWPDSEVVESWSGPRWRTPERDRLDI